MVQLLAYLLLHLVSSRTHHMLSSLPNGPIAPLIRCQSIYLLAGWFAAVGIPLNALLFLARIIAVFHDKRAIRMLFVTLWFFTLASFIVPFAENAQHLSPSHICTVLGVTTAGSAGAIIASTYDTLVFIAISSRILLDYPASGFKARIKLFWNNKNMSRIYRMVLQTGQLYYLFVKYTTRSIFVF